MSTIGEKIKAYRQKNNMTQGQLAACLNITYQTVSKWETGVSNPDLSLIIPLTKLFHVSADELLGIDDVEHDKQYDELKIAYEHTFQTENFVERQRICELAVAEYPNDMKWRLNLAWTMSNRSFEYEDHEKHVAEQEKAIKQFDEIIKNCDDDFIRGNAICGITQLLGWRGRKGEAKEYVEMLPEKAFTTREAVWENVLEGDELVLFKQKRIMSHLKGILWDLSLMPDVFTDEMQRIVEVMFPDGNYLEFNHSMFYAIRKQINRILKTDENVSVECICELLDRMTIYAKAYDEILFVNPGVYKYTAPWFNLIEEDTRDWLGNKGTTMLEDLCTYLNEPQFDKIRGCELFKSLKV
jgi:transcriptional regulator with XRE-family HTH domain